MKHVKSTDPRKKTVVAALKLKAGANKVTLVKETQDGFEGHCLKSLGARQYQDLGTFTLSNDEFAAYLGLSAT